VRVLTTIRSRLTYSNVIASLALFVALGGGAYAAIKIPKNSVGTAQIKSNAVISSKVKDRSLLALDFKGGQLPQGAQGIQGAKGDKGDTGTVDTSNFYTKSQSDSQFAAKDTSGVMNVPTTGTTLLTHGTVSFTATCADQGAGVFEVIVNGQSSEANSSLGEPGSQTDLAGTPTEIDRSTSDVYVVRQLGGAVVTPTQAFNVLITRGVNRGGANNCFAGVTVLP
jgi:hypothetical protein